MSEVENKYTIPAENLPLLQKKVGQVNKRARKLGVPEFELNVLGTYVRTYGDDWVGNPLYREYVDFTLTGEAPKFSGWQFIATIDHALSEDGINVIKRVPTYEGEIPESYQHTDALLCEHCNTRRQRNETFLIQHDDGTVKQVGRQCLRDFLGHQSPEFVARLYATLRDGLEEASTDNFEGEWSDSGGPLLFNLRSFLATANAAIRQFGFRKTDSDDPTRNLVTRAVQGIPKWASGEEKKFLREFRETIDNEDYEKADAIIEWARNLDPKGNDYLLNVQAVCSEDYLSLGRDGIAASVPVAYDRAMGEIKERERKKKESNHLGEIKERIKFGEVEVLFVTSFETQFGVTTLYKFADSEGNIIVWFSSRGANLEVGDKVKLTGTVKKHDEYNEVAQTIITRAKVED